ncbi:hypothetical protein I7I50_00548 [Histoplasma capsulatum G186AR]|uniref:Uncharacterized protein n=1 Tax=Ajellomyces capsulatus TaxID=5037 RepID=A0A8H7YIQ5_AJECA|nr:hypothetical protein I7I52_07816 [Histoplasma capsulatum]QSS72636.1 hypothetical protein I7I50_00548 [Histoplasma capsulatum G186AR]
MGIPKDAEDKQNFADRGEYVSIVDSNSKRTRLDERIYFVIGVEGLQTPVFSNCNEAVSERKTWMVFKCGRVVHWLMKLCSGIYHTFVPQLLLSSNTNIGE